MRWASKLKGQIIKDVIINRKERKDGDFEFVPTLERWDNLVRVLHFGKLLLSFSFDYIHCRKCNDYVYAGTKCICKHTEIIGNFRILLFNPLTDNDMFSINHIIATLGDITIRREQHTDKGKVDIVNNNYVLIRKDNYYTFSKLWRVGEVKNDNFDKNLTYEFSKTSERYAGKYEQVF